MKRFYLNSFFLNLFCTYVVPKTIKSICLLLRGPSDMTGVIFEEMKYIFTWMDTQMSEFFETASQVTFPTGHQQNPRVFFFNHRSWADFWIDYVVCGGCAFVANPIVWLLVICFSPCLYVYDVMITLFGVKGGPGTTMRLRKILTDYRTQHPRTNIGVYPEGKRHHGADSLPLKMAIVDWCFHQNEHVQIIITSNKEQVLNEFRWTSCLGAKLFVARSPVLEPSSFESVESWRAAIESAWKDAWRKAYHPKVALVSGKGTWEPLRLPHMPTPFAPDTSACTPAEACERKKRWYKCLGLAGFFLTTAAVLTVIYCF